MSGNGIAMRNAFGQSLLNLGDEIQELVVLDADVSSSTQTFMFGKKYPERFFNVGVAEANMADIAAGMATCGLRPVINTFAIFMVLKCTDQIRNVICYNNLNVVLAGNYAGLSDSFDGASHQSVIDIAIMRAMPNMKVIVPADSTEMEQSLKIALSLKGPTYIRICRNPTPVLFSNSEPFQFGKIRKVRVGKDITIAVCGVPVYMAVEAASLLETEGISAEILNVSTIKPLDKKTLMDSANKTGRILTVEEHSLIGGLGSAVAEAINTKSSIKLAMIGIRDTFTESGPYEEILEKYGISTKAIVTSVKQLVSD